MKIIDIEADSLHPSKIWCVVTLDVNTGEEYVWRYDSGLPLRLDLDDCYIGHNILGFDLPALRDVLRINLARTKCIDTLVCSRTINFQVKGGHSLAAWGERLGENKTEFSEWSHYDDPEAERGRMDRCVSYCRQDVRTNHKLWTFLEPHIRSDRWKKALRLEHDTANICRDLHDNGFTFDVERTRELRKELDQDVSVLLEQLQKAFPARAYPIREINPKLTKAGTLSRVDFRWAGGDDLAEYSAGAPFTRIGWEEFNPGSPQQVVRVLNEAGWNPIEKTDGYKDTEKEYRDYRRRPKRQQDPEYLRALEVSLEKYEEVGWKISEENLATLPETAPEACKVLIKHRMLSKRLQTVDEWLSCYNQTTGRIHGNFNGIGTWTHRKSHSDPNQGNVPSVDSKYHNSELKAIAKYTGKAMRSLFTVPRGRRLVGVDADGIQLRVLAHYMDDAEFTEALINGVKYDDAPERSTDVHTLNALKLGLSYLDRPRAKTFIYAWLLGAGNYKVAKILGLDARGAGDAVQSFIEGYPGLEKLKTEVIPADARRGFFVGFDGRLIKSDEYHMLAGYLQAGESVIMKEAARIWHDQLRRDGIEYLQVNDVHDEWQTEVPDDDAIVEHVIKVQAASITRAGENFGLRCPFVGSGKFGYNWCDTH